METLIIAVLFALACALYEYATWPDAEEIARRKLSNDLRRIRGSR